MRARGLLPILLLNVIVSVAVAFGVIAIFNSNASDRENERLVTLEVVVTATPDPDVTPNVVIITTTPRPGDPQTVDIPDEALADAASNPSSDDDDDELDEDGVSVARAGSGTDEDGDLPPGCILHTLADGDSPYGVALEYGANPFSLMAVNNLTEESARFLRTGQTLIVPLDGCPIELFVAESEAPTATPQADDDDDEADDDATPQPTPTITPIPTVTLAPTAANSQIRIMEVIGVGDITRESVVIRNDGMTTDIGGWQLTDIDDNTFTFPADIRLWGGAGVTVNTRDGANTPIQFFWGRDSAIFESGDVLTLRDRDGAVRATFRVP
ncbi:MAG: hypothetical protein EA396_07485 [Anaerolineaceae bacterium]|nr:MAG: hypothetical protein EA396_07485 [Anaerolineaceae bacterium]